MKNDDVSRFLNTIADYLDVLGEAQFRTKTYREMSRKVYGLSPDIEVWQEQGTLQDIPGIGVSLAQKIDEFLSTGRSDYLEDLKSKIPSGVVEMLQVTGVGPKRALKFYTTLGIDTLKKLEEAARTHQLEKLPGISYKICESIVREIQRLETRGQRHLLSTASIVAEDFMSWVAGDDVIHIMPTGSLRRGRESVRDIDILVASTAPEDVIDRFVTHPRVKNIQAQGSTKASIVTHDDIQVDLRVVKLESWGAALQYFTGSAQHNIRLRQIALSKGYSINEYGIWTVEGGYRAGGNNEVDIYHTLGLPFIPPELREDWGELDFALTVGPREYARDKAFDSLITWDKIKGDLHVHSEWSDGADSILNLAFSSPSNLEYIAICDHSQGLGIANGLDPEQLFLQWDEIDIANKRSPKAKLLKGTEMEIKADGSLDFPDELLGYFDVVVAAVHNALQQDRDLITKRIVSAMRNPHVDIIAHPTGRMINRRDGADLDMEEIYRVAAETHTVLEINSAPSRLDLPDSCIKRAAGLGVMFAISTDAHSVEHLPWMTYGVRTARRGWCTTNKVINTLTYDALMYELRKPKGERFDYNV